MDVWLLLGDIVLLLAACLLVGGICSRWGQSPLVGYLIAGMVLGGPGSIQAVRSPKEIEAVAELGVALLLFSLGLEFSVARLKKLGPQPLLGGIVQVLLTTALGAAGAYLLGAAVRPAIAFGAMISLSSTAVVLRILQQRVELELPHGRNSLGVLLTQDLAVVPLALVMTVLGGEGDAASILLDVGKLILMAAALIAGLFLLNWIAVRALGTLTLHRNRELTVIFAGVTGLGAAWAAHAAGISPALGAFVAGMLLGSSAFATQIRADVSSLRVLLLTLFFGAAGMVADPIWILKNGHIVLALTGALTIGKFVVIASIFLILGQSTRTAAATGIALAQVGEFAFVLGSIGRANGVVSEEFYALVVSVTVVSFLISAVLVPLAPRFGHRVALMAGRASKTDDATPGVGPPPELVIIGFGPAGQIAARPFVGQNRAVLVVDLNHKGIRLAEQMGFQGQVGDATLPDVLDHIHLNGARAIVITIPDHRAAMTILELVLHRAPTANVVLRSRYQIYSAEFTTAGADFVVGDEEQVGDRLAEYLTERLAHHSKGDRSLEE